MEIQLNRIFQVLLLTFGLMSSVLATTQFLIVSDIHYGSENNSQDGQDTGPELLNAALQQIKKLSKNVDFILNLGDLPTHGLFVTAKAEFERTIFHGLFEADTSLKPMFYITGNNDSLSGNYQPFEFQGQSPLNLASDWTGACVFCKGLVIDDTNMQSGGYYSSYVMPNNKEIILIALNTAPWVNIAFPLPKYINQEADALSELNWLEQQLKHHSAKQLLIAMHVPPGKSYKDRFFWHKEYLKRFISLLEENHQSYGQITLLTGHTHMDEIRKIPLQDGTNIYAFHTPAISRIHHNNPGLKIVTLNNEMAVKDYTTYYTTSINQWGTEQYQTTGTSDAIFPKCQDKTLAQCLDGLTDKQVCSYLEQGLFYGVKSDRVPANVCKTTYPVVVKE